MTLSLETFSFRAAMAALTYNPSYLGSRGRRTEVKD
jgi:hypothetical protein